MAHEKDPEGKFSRLRTRAEESLSGKPTEMEDISALSPEEVERLVHELRVHQIEMEMQNEELRQAQIKLEELKDNYLDLYDFAPVGYVTLNEKGLILEANLTAVRLLGEERKTLIKMPFSHFVSQEFGDAYYLYVQQVFETQSKQTCEIKLAGEDGTHFYAQLESVPIRGEDGQFSRCRTVMLDISERKNAEEKAEQFRAQLFQAQKMEAIATLTGGIAHDFNNLLTIINGYTETILLDKTEDDPEYSDLQIVLETGHKGADLVLRLLALSKKADATLRPLDVNSIVENSIRLIERTFPKIIEIKTILGKDLDRVNADTSNVEQVLMNLYINAKEAMPDGGRLKIETRKVAVDKDYCRLNSGASPGSFVIIEVSDSGRGIDADTMVRIFDPFFSTKGWDSMKGTGLGLPVAKGIVEQYGGWMTCKSEPGKGTTFTVYFPVI